MFWNFPFFSDYFSACQLEHILIFQKHLLHNMIDTFRFFIVEKQARAAKWAYIHSQGSEFSYVYPETWSSSYVLYKWESSKTAYDPAKGVPC